MQCTDTPSSRAILSRLTLAAATVLLTASLAWAQQPADDPAAPDQAQQAQQPADNPAAPAQARQAGQPSPKQLAWNFDKDPVDGWHYACQHALVPTQGGRALQVSGGHAIWDPVGEISDFVLKFRYGYESGAGDVFFRPSQTSLGEECYCLKLSPDGITLARRLNKPTDEGYPEKELVSQRGMFKPHKWYAITIRAVGGQIDVLIGNQKALSYRDPEPLTAGTFGLGAAGSGVALYDDVALTAVLTPPPAPKPMEASTFNWP